MLTAAYAQGIGAVWRTGDLAYDSKFSAELGLTRNEAIVGFLYLGTASASCEAKAPKMNTEDYFQSWP